MSISIFFFETGPLKFDLTFSNCFQPIVSFNHFIPLDTQLIFLNITCEYFQMGEPRYAKTRYAIFLTPTLVINTRSNHCPSVDKYLWLNSKYSKKSFSLRTLTCENRLIQLNFDIIQTSIEHTSTSTTLQMLFIRTSTSTNLKLLIIINFCVVLVSILMLIFAFLMYFIRFLRK